MCAFVCVRTHACIYITIASETVKNMVALLVSLLPCKSGIALSHPAALSIFLCPLSPTVVVPQSILKIILFSQPSRGTGTETEPWPCCSFDVLFHLFNAALTALMLSIDVQTLQNTIFFFFLIKLEQSHKTRFV